MYNIFYRVVTGVGQKYRTRSFPTHRRRHDVTGSTRSIVGKYERCRRRGFRLKATTTDVSGYGRRSGVGAGEESGGRGMISRVCWVLIVAGPCNADFVLLPTCRTASSLSVYLRCCVYPRRYRGDVAENTTILWPSAVWRQRWPPLPPPPHPATRVGLLWTLGRLYPCYPSKRYRDPARHCGRGAGEILCSTVSGNLFAGAHRMTNVIAVRSGGNSLRSNFHVHGIPTIETASQHGHRLMFASCPSRLLSARVEKNSTVIFTTSGRFRHASMSQ